MPQISGSERSIKYMKRAVVFPLLILIIFSSCSRQEEIDFDILINRISDSEQTDTIIEKSIYYEENTSYCFFNDKSGNQFLISAVSDERGCVYKISLSSDKTNPKDFYEVADLICKAYVNESDVSLDLNQLFSSQINSETLYADTQWYSYSLSRYDSFSLFTVQNKKLCEISENELTLKANDKSYISK